MARPVQLAVLLALAVLLPGSAAAASTAQPQAGAPYFVNSLQCPEVVVQVPPGNATNPTDLSALPSFLAPNTTYLLPAGRYVISKQVIKTGVANAMEMTETVQGAETYCIIRQGGSRSDVVVQSTVNAADTTARQRGRTFRLDEAPGVRLGIRGVVLDGGSQISGFAVVDTELQLQDVTGQNFVNLNLLNPNDRDGGFVNVFSGVLNAVNVSLVNNTARQGGMLFCGGSNSRFATINFTQAEFFGNQATAGGGVLAATRRCTVNLNGPSTLSNNSAPVGGTVWEASRFLAPAVVNIYGPLCAQGNTAIRGGFASIQGSANVSVSDAAAVNIANNPGSDLDVRRLVFNVSGVPAVGAPVVNCPDAAATVLADGAYNITGSLCGCVAQFAQDNTTTTCSTCAQVFNEATCSCGCTEGSCCDVRTTSFLPDGAKCFDSPPNSSTNGQAPGKPGKPGRPVQCVPALMKPVPAEQAGRKQCRGECQAGVCVLE